MLEHEFDEEQRQRVTAWILQGAKLSEIQNRLAAEFGIKLTYMEVALPRGRFETDAERPGTAESRRAARRNSSQTYG